MIKSTRLEGHDEKPLKRDEYFSMMYLMAIRTASGKCLETLGPRLKTCGRIARELVRINRSSYKLLDALLYTTPRNQHANMMRDLERTEFILRTAAASSLDNDSQDYVSISRTNMAQLISYVLKCECEMCEKTGKAARKCPASRLLQTTAGYDIPKVMPDGTCFWNLYHVDYSDDPQERINQCDDDCYGEEVPEVREAASE